MLACLDGGQKLCGEVDANNGAGRSRKSRACWRALTKDKGFTGRSTPTMTPAGRGNPEHVGVPRRRIKTLQGGRRQHGRRQRHRWPELEVRDGFKIRIKILIALIDSYIRFFNIVFTLSFIVIQGSFILFRYKDNFSILLCIRRILYRFFFC